jgi:23S rRNA (adenine2503-C2)-methyltransferase
MMHFSLRIDRRDSFESRVFDEQRSQKYLVSLIDGAQVETTLYHHWLRGVPTDVAIDLSTMVGCPMTCAFCASATIPYQRPLTVSEIVGQAAHFVAQGALAAPQITCSFQGIGEPSLIPKRIVESARRMLALDPRVVISVSTMARRPAGVRHIVESGLPIESFQLSMGRELPGTSVRTIPQSPGLPTIAELARELAAARTVNKVKVNVILVEGLRNSVRFKDELIDAFAHSSISVRVSWLNETGGSALSRLVPSAIDHAREFSSELQQRGVDSYVFGAFENIGVSCGQLALLDRS